MRHIDGFQDLKPPADYVPNWEVDLYLCDRGTGSLWIPWIAVMALAQMSVGIAIGYWIATW